MTGKIARVVFFAFFLCQSVEADGRHAIHVLSIGPGTHLFTMFGHIALMVENLKTGSKIVYNFGEFDINQPNLVGRYALGTLKYWVAVSSYDVLVRGCNKHNRSLVVRTLDLPDEGISLLLDELKESTSPQNREYAYNHFTNNCCTRVRDLLNRATKGQLAISSAAKGRTYRYWVRRSLEGRPALNWSAQLFFGPSVDKPITRWREMYLPEVFSEELDRIRLNPGQRPLVKLKRDLSFGRGGDKRSMASMAEQLISIGILCLAVICLAAPLFAPQRRFSRRACGVGLSCFGLVAGLGSIAMLVLWIFTNHTYWHANENILVFLPTHLMLVVPGIKLSIHGGLGRRIKRVLTVYLVFSIGLAAFAAAMKLGVFHQSNGLFIASGLLFDGIALASIRLVRDSEQQREPVN